MTMLPVFEIHSFPGSREGLLLRCLSAHPRVHVVHQLLGKDDPRDVALAEFAFANGTAALDSQAPPLEHLSLKDQSVLVLASALHRPGATRHGIVYARNPFDLMAGLGFTQAEKLPDYNRSHQRLERWAARIDSRMKRFVMDNDHLTAACCLYQRRMLSLAGAGHPVVHHEQLQADPEPLLRQVLASMGLEWDARVMAAQRAFAKGQEGREGLRLWEPIARAFTEVKPELDQASVDRIYSLCAPTLDAFGYRMDGRQISVDVDFRVGRDGSVARGDRSPER